MLAESQKKTQVKVICLRDSARTRHVHTSTYELSRSPEPVLQQTRLGKRKRSGIVSTIDGDISGSKHTGKYIL